MKFKQLHVSLQNTSKAIHETDAVVFVHVFCYNIVWGMLKAEWYKLWSSSCGDTSKIYHMARKTLQWIRFENQNELLYYRTKLIHNIGAQKIYKNFAKVSNTG